MATKVNFVELNTLDEAKQKAAVATPDIGGRSFPVSIFNQGDRKLISTVFSFEYIIQELKTNPSERDKGVRDVRTAMNRPIDLPHAKTTKEYLKRNYQDKYILPAMTLNIQDPITIFTAKFPGSAVKPGYMIIPYGVKFSVTDGQHRKRAIEDLCKELTPAEYNKIKNDAVCVMITIEDDINQIHQDFADCSKTKPLPKSMIAVYDKRNPANALVIDLIESCALFEGKVDATRTTLSKKSVKLLLVSQVRSLIKELCIGNSSAGDVDFETTTIDLYVDANSATYKTDVEKFKAFVNKITEKIPILNKAASLKDGIEMSQVPQLREEYLILNSAGLNIVGRIGHEIFKNGLEGNLDQYIDALAKINWKKSGEIWKGNIVQQGEKGLKIATSNSTLKEAVRRVKAEIGLPEKQQIMDI